MILVTGATGKLGRLVIDALLKRTSGANLIAGVRTPSKATDIAAKGVTVRAFDYAAPATLTEALSGVDTLLLISSNDLESRIAQHRAVVQAAKERGVKRIVYTSLLHAPTSTLGLAKDHLATEQAIQASGLDYTFLRNGWYIENYTESLAPALQHGVMLGAARDGKVAPAARADFAEAAAVVLTTPNHPRKAYELAGDTAYTMSELAAIVAAKSGKPVIYKDLPQADYSAALTSVGLPKPFAELLADSDTGLARGDLNDSTGDLRTLIGRATTPFADVVSTTLATR